MQILKNIAILIFAFITLVYAVVTFFPSSGISVMQTVSFDGKKVYLAQKGDGPISYKTETGNGTLIVNGQPLDLSGGNEFTVVFSSNGSYEVKKGAP